MDIDRERLIGLAYGMLGSRASAEDIVQEAWLRLSRTDDVREPNAWMRTVVGRLALDPDVGHDEPHAADRERLVDRRRRTAGPRRPMRRRRLTVPPAPGIKPIDNSGNRKLASDEATNRPANAGISIPAPTQAP